MRRPIGLVWISAAFFGLVAAADAQAPTPSAGSPFDGTYRFVSSAKINKTYVTRGGRIGQCPDRAAGPLTIAQGQARYTSATGRQLEGSVGSRGELAMQFAAPPDSNGYRPIELSVDGSIDGTGTARARQRSNSCSYNFVWQK